MRRNYAAPRLDHPATHTRDLDSRNPVNLGWFGDSETAGGSSVKKLASWALLLMLTNLFFFPMPWLMKKNSATINQVNAPVAHTGRELQTGQLFEPAQATNVLPAFQPALQTAQRAPTLPTLHPNQVQKPAGDLLQTTAAPDNFQRFVDTVKDGEAGVLRGVYVDGVLALAVIQQPKKDVLYASSVRGIATQFQKAAKFGITGLNVRNRCTHPLDFDNHPPTFPVLQVSKSRLIAWYSSRVISPLA